MTIHVRHADTPAVRRRAAAMVGLLAVACGGGGATAPPTVAPAGTTRPLTTEHATGDVPATTAAAVDHCAEVHIDPATQECRNGPTPAGGAYSIATFLDDAFNPVPEADATQVSISELDADGNELQSTLGSLGG